MAGNDISGFEAFGLEVIDSDEIDEDSDYSYDRLINVGGQSVEEHEGAYLSTTLEGGKEYIFVVGASSGTGAYELNLKKVAQ